MPVASIDGPDRFDFWARGVWGDVQKQMLEAIGHLGGDPDARRSRARAGDRAPHARPRSSTDSSRRSAPKDGEKNGFASPVAYPRGDDDFPRRLAGLAAMLAAGLPLRCVALTAPGSYDTHDNQAGDLNDGLKLTADSLLAFQRDLEARGLADRVLVHVWSEFGRRAEENALRRAPTTAPPARAS